MIRRFCSVGKVLCETNIQINYRDCICQMHKMLNVNIIIGNQLIHTSYQQCPYQNTAVVMSSEC